MRALLLVDIQNDFIPGGALPVPRGEEVVPVTNRLQPFMDLVIATQDWHPPSHGSFAVNHPGKKAGDVIDLNGISQILWPPHCVQNTHGAEFHPSLSLERIVRVFRKGTDPGIDSYSGFFDNGHRKSTGLENYLREKAVSEVYLAGLTTEYCVKYTALDARKLGFSIWIVLDGCQGLEARPGDQANALEEMRNAGARIVQSEQVIRRDRSRSTLV
ncbi:MAG TPA: bifunctional nicotinamidase/pyrazinamidase [Acidobacteriota bacterium]|jgi:nicotinamidase/pyrazinamidase